MAIVVNKHLPEFEANATGGVKVSHQSHLGQTVILYFYPKDKSIKDEFIKLIIIFSLGMIFIYFFFPMFSFTTQTIVFFRILQFSFFIAYTFKNKLLNWQIHGSVWMLLLSNIISVLFLYISPSKNYHILVMSSLFASKFLFVNGLIQSIKIKKDNRLEV
jgi:hypothetical protein